MDRGAWQAMVHRVEKSWTQLKPLSIGMHYLSLAIVDQTTYKQSKIFTFKIFL